MAIGYISYINSLKGYGFIDSPDMQLEDIFFHFTECKKEYKHIYKGDKVDFELETESNKGNEAKSVSFVRNASLDNLKIDFEKETTLKGYLNKIGDYYYVKDRETCIFIRLLIANYEINLKQVYEDNLNNLVEYRIITFSKKNKIRAININRQFLPECKLLMKGNKTEGEVIEAVKGGYLIKIYNNIKGFLPNSLVLFSKDTLEVGEMVKVTCIEVRDDFSNVVFNLTDNFENEVHSEDEKEMILSNLNENDLLIGKIKATCGFGVFVSLSFGEGLLHINNILGEEYNLPTLLKKEFTNIIAEIFSKECAVEVFIEKIANEKISLNWHNTSKINQGFFNEIYSKYKKIKVDEKL